MLICLKKCNRMRLTVRIRPWRDLISKKILPPTSRKSSIRSTTPRGTALSEGILAVMSPMRLDTLFTST